MAADRTAASKDIFAFSDVYGKALVFSKLTISVAYYGQNEETEGYRGLQENSSYLVKYIKILLKTVKKE